MIDIEELMKKSEKKNIIIYFQDGDVINTFNHCFQPSQEDNEENFIEIDEDIIVYQSEIKSIKIID